MATPHATLTLSSDWDKLEALLDAPAAARRVRQMVSRATAINGSLLRKEARRQIKMNTPPPLASLTEMIKHSTKSLVDDGDLWKAITSHSTAWNVVEVGVKKGTPEANTAVIVHEGTLIPVTARMRTMFWYLYQASVGDIEASELTGRAADLWKRQPGGWKPLKGATTHIRIPARQFLRNAVNDGALQSKVATNWANAFAAAIAGQPTFPVVT